MEGRLRKLALREHLDSQAAQGPDVILEGLALFGTEELGRVPVECVIVDKVFLLAVDRGSLHHVDEQVALLIVKDRLGVQLVMALLVEVQMLHTQRDLFQIAFG